MSERNVIGQAECFDCGAAVELRVDKSGRVYGACDGRIARRLCGATFKFSRPTSGRMIEEARNAENQDQSVEEGTEA